MKEIISLSSSIIAADLDAVDKCLAVKNPEFTEFMAFGEFVEFMANLTAQAYNPDKGRRLSITRLHKSGKGTDVVFDFFTGKDNSVEQLQVTTSGGGKGSAVVYDKKWVFALTTKAVENHLVVMTKPANNRKVAADVYVIELSLSLAPFVQCSELVH